MKDGGSPPEAEAGLLATEAPAAVPSPPLRATFETIPSSHMRQLVPAKPVAEQRLDVVKRADDRLRTRAHRLMEHVADACRIDDEGLPVDGTKVDPVSGRPEGWSGVKYQVAKDARKPLKYQPGYLPLMARVHDSYRRTDGDKDAPTALAADIRVYVNNAVFNYPVRDVSDPDKK